MAACFDANFLSKMDGDLGGPTAISTLRPVGLQIDLRPGEFRLEGELAHRVEIKIADFGLAKHLDAEDQRTQTGSASVLQVTWLPSKFKATSQALARPATSIRSEQSFTIFS